LVVTTSYYWHLLGRGPLTSTAIIKNAKTKIKLLISDEEWVMNHWTKYLSHRKRFRFDLRNIFLTMRLFGVKTIVIERTVTLHSESQQSNLGSLKHYQCPAPPPRESNLSSQEWDPLMGIFVKAPQIILMRARAAYQWPKAKNKSPNSVCLSKTFTLCLKVYFCVKFTFNQKEACCCRSTAYITPTHTQALGLEQLSSCPCCPSVRDLTIMTILA